MPAVTLLATCQPPPNVAEERGEFRGGGQLSPPRIYLWLAMLSTTRSAGPRRISHKVGKTQPTVGRRIFNDARAASTLIFNRRLTRICAAWAAMVRAIGTPGRSAGRTDRPS